MNCVAKLTAVLMDSQRTCRMLQRRVALIHSTPILDGRRKRGTNYYRSKYSKSTKNQYKSAQGWESVYGYFDFSIHFWPNEPNTRWPGNKGPKNKGKRGFQFTDDDDETNFRFAFGGENGCSFCSFVNEEKPGRRSFYKSRLDYNGFICLSICCAGGFQFTDNDVETNFRSAFGGEYGYSLRSFFNEEKPGRGSFYEYSNFRDSQNWRYQFEDEYEYSNFRDSQNWSYQFEDEYDSYTEPDYSSKSDLTSDRKALGLTVSGPLKLEEVKKAYRACALKWHPDHHQGSSKVAAEEKFKVCSAAYNSLCDNLALK